MLVKSEITERFEIDQSDDDLGNLIEVFTTERRTQDLPLLPLKAEEEAEKIRKKKINKGITRLSKELPHSFQPEEISKAISELTAQYLTSELSLHYDQISSDMFRLERVLQFEERKDYREKIKVKIPLFASARLGETTWMLKNAQTISNNNQYEINIKCPVPPLISEARAQVKEARARYMRTCLDVLGQPGVGDFFARDLESGKAAFDMGIYWIPELSHLEIEVKEVKRDPVVIGRVYKKNYLIAKWDTLGEEPFEHYIKEFTEETKKDD